MPREINLEGRAKSGCAAYINKATVLIDYVSLRRVFLRSGGLIPVTIKMSIKARFPDIAAIPHTDIPSAHSSSANLSFVGSTGFISCLSSPRSPDCL